MKNQFWVLHGKTILGALFIIGMLIGLIVHDTMVETVTNKKLLPIYSVACEDMRVALTFDCAWGAGDIEEIVNTLNDNDVQACFFTVGSWVEKNAKAVKLLHDNFMEIGNHSNSHAHVGKLSFEENLEDMKLCNEKISAITGKKVSYYRRCLWRILK